jgi:hypothetical protein
VVPNISYRFLPSAAGWWWLLLLLRVASLLFLSVAVRMFCVSVSSMFTLHNN